MSHYKSEYFNWQKNIGSFGASVDLFKFVDEIKSDDKVIDFGSGGGYVLAHLECKEKIGVEINPTARENANELGITTYSSPDEIEDNWADVIISHHALEHTENPLMELKRLYTKLSPNGKIVFVVPCEKKTKYKPGDIDFHLFTWSEQNLGNLFSLAGFKVERVFEFKHKWPPFYVKFRKLLGGKLFYYLCRVYGIMNNRRTQIKIIATKK